MKKLTLLLIFILVFINIISAAEKIKVACIGNSITYGHGIKDPEKRYPALLQQLLGDKYEVANFGVSGRTMLNKGNLPYMNEQKYQDALAFNPDIVVIKLGTNDSKPRNWVYKEEFKGDMQAMINELKNLPSKPTIYLCLPVPAPGSTDISDEVLENEIIPIIKEIAAKNNLTTIDLRTPLLDFPQYFPDTIHPNEEGTEVMAKEIYQVLMRQQQIK